MHVLGFLRVFPTSREPAQPKNSTVILVTISVWCGLDLHINLDSTWDVVNAFKNVDKGIVNFPHILRRLENKILSITSQLERGRGNTHGEEDTSSGKKIGFVGQDAVQDMVELRTYVSKLIE